MGNFHIGRIAGIEVKLHVTFPLFVLCAAIFYGARTSWLEGLQFIGVLSTLFAFVLLHELGHSLVAQRLGVRVLSITLLPIGGMAATGPMPRRPLYEILIALAGPAVNVVLAIVFGIILATSNLPIDLAGSGPGFWLSYLMSTNIVLALFNLVPAFPMDGGRVLRALLAWRLPYRRATQRAVVIGKVFAVGFFLLGLIKPSFIMLSFVGAFLFFAGRREQQSLDYEEFMHENKAGDFVDPRPWFYGGRNTRFGDLAGAMAQNDELAYSVLDLEGLRYGILTRRELMTACLALPPMLEARRLLAESLPAMPAQLPLGQALPILRRSPRGLMPVRNGREIIGVISLESLESALRGYGRGV